MQRDHPTTFKTVHKTIRELRKTEKPDPAGSRAAGSLLLQMTAGLLETYCQCDPSLRTYNFHRPRRFITKNKDPAHNEGNDNSDYDLIVAVDDELYNRKKEKYYMVKEGLGSGTFGQVLHVEEKGTGKQYAAKVIKSKERYAEFALNFEVKVLQQVNKYERRFKAGKIDIEGIEVSDHSRVISLVEKFMFKKHMVLIFEKLDMSLLDLMELAECQGLTLNVVRKLGRNILEGLCVLKKAKIVHCDLKPENIMLINKKSDQLKIIDLGSACSQKRFPFDYFQSRYYRAPEVFLGLMPFTPAVDMWSVGCILLELYLGIPIFPGSNLHDMISKMVEFLGMPDKELLDHSPNSGQYFEQTDSGYRMFSHEEFCQTSNQQMKTPQKYHNFSCPQDLEAAYNESELRATARSSDKARLKDFIDLISRVMLFDPTKRIDPIEALEHPFFREFAKVPAKPSFKTSKKQQGVQRQLGEQAYQEGNQVDSFQVTTT